MKHHFLSFCLCLLAVCSFAQGTINIHGVISNRLSDTVRFTWSDDSRIYYEGEEKKLVLDKNGAFSLKIPVSTDYMIINWQNGAEGTQLIAGSGADISLKVDARHFDSTLRYSGKGSEPAQFASKYIFKVGNIYTFSGELQRYMGKSKDSFMTLLHREWDKEIAFYNANKTGLPASFDRYWNNFLRYTAYKAILNYPPFHEMIKQKSFTVRDIPKENYAVLEHAPDSFDDALLHIPVYQQYVTAYFQVKLAAAGYNNKADTLHQYQQDDSVLTLVRTRMPKATASFVAASLLHDGIKYRPLQRSEYLLAQYRQAYPGSRYLAQLSARLEAYKKFQPGQPAMDFAFTTIDGNKTRLSDYKGKVVLLDFWASWCGPCIAQLPGAKKLHDHFKDKPVVFLYYSIDEDLASWKKAIEKHNIEGVHTVDAEGWNGTVAKSYGVNGVPAYFLVDTKGNFAIENVPRPDETEKLIAEIEKLLP